jgi:hypothetical protein
VPPRQSGVKLEPPQPRSGEENELDAGERRSMIASGESLLGCGLPWMRRPPGGAGFPGSVRESAGVVSHPPIRPPARGGDHDHVLRDRAAQSIRRARAVARLRLIFELARGHATPPGIVTAPLSAARQVAGLGHARLR